MLFFMLKNVKMPTLVGILTILSKKNHAQLSWAWKNFYNLGACMSVRLRDIKFQALLINSFDD